MFILLISSNSEVQSPSLAPSATAQLCRLDVAASVKNNVLDVFSAARFASSAPTFLATCVSAVLGEHFLRWSSNEGLSVVSSDELRVYILERSVHLRRGMQPCRISCAHALASRQSGFYWNLFWKTYFSPSYFFGLGGFAFLMSDELAGITDAPCV